MSRIEYRGSGIAEYRGSMIAARRGMACRASAKPRGDGHGENLKHEFSVKMSARNHKRPRCSAQINRTNRRESRIGRRLGMIGQVGWAKFRSDSSWLTPQSQRPSGWEPGSRQTPHFRALAPEALRFACEMRSSSPYFTSTFRRACASNQVLVGSARPSGFSTFL